MSTLDLPAAPEPVPGDGRWHGLGRGVANFVQLQVGWFACVLGAAAGLYWLGPAVVAVLVILCLRFSLDRRRDAELVLGLGLLGTVIDSTLSALGLLTFAGSFVAWLCPPWITALWFHFGTQRETLLRLAAERPGLVALVGAVGGPLAYRAGVELGAASFHATNPWQSWLALALVWGTILPLAGRWAWRSTPPSNPEKTPATGSGRAMKKTP